MIPGDLSVFPFLSLLLPPPLSFSFLLILFCFSYFDIQGVIPETQTFQKPDLQICCFHVVL